MKDLCLVINTFSKYADVWPIFFDSLEEHLPALKRYVFVDEGEPDSKSVTVYYDETKLFRTQFLDCIKEVSEFVPNSFTYRAPVFRALYRVGFENTLTDQQLKTIIKAVIDSPKSKQLIKLPNGNEVISFMYQYITNVLCDKIGIPVNKPESITYTTRPGDKSG